MHRRQTLDTWQCMYVTISGKMCTKNCNFAFQVELLNPWMQRPQTPFQGSGARLRCRQWRQSWHHDNSRFPVVISLKTKHRQFDFVANGGTVSCHNDNLRCRQWWQSWHHENSHFPVVIMIYSPAPPQSGCARLLYQPSYGVYSYSASSSSPESEKKNPENIGQFLLQKRHGGLTHWDLVMLHISVSKMGDDWLIQVMACRLFDTKPLPYPGLLDPWGCCNVLLD